MAAVSKGEAVLDAAIATRNAERRHDIRLIYSWRILLLVAILVVWQAASGTLVDPFFFSSPGAIGRSLHELWQSGRLVDNVGYTIYEACVGYVLGAALAIVAAAIFGPSPRLNAVVEPFIAAVYSVPSIAMAPLLIVWFGVGVTSKVLLAAYLVFFVVYMNAVAGMRGVRRGWVDIARQMGATRSQLLTKIVLRGAAPHVAAGLKLAVPEAVIGAVVGEFISAQKGIGYLILDASSKYQTAGVFAAVFVLGALALVMAAGLHASSNAGVRRM